MTARHPEKNHSATAEEVTVTAANARAGTKPRRVRGQRRRRREKSAATAALALAALVLAACPERPPQPPRPAQGEASSPQVVRIVFDLPGDDIGGPEAQALLDDVKAAILERQAGEIVRSGHGMGETQIVVRYQGDDAPGKIKQAIDAARPGAKYRIVREAR